MNSATLDVSAKVHRQYEDHPYPPRDPGDEKKRLIRTRLDTLDLLNHHCYAGRQSFRSGFRALVAGGGTGDSLIHLAWQLRGTDAEVHYLDISEASKEVARKRARVRGLGNIVWHHARIEDLPAMGLPKFDYVNCTGVLHHLQDPEAGLAALRAVLRDGGAMGLMLYGQIGRTGVYQVQELLRGINGDDASDSERVAVARQVLAALPQTHWFGHSSEWFGDHKVFGDAGIHDLFLHARDRAYTVGQVHEFLASASLRLVAWSGDERIRLHPEFWLPEGPARDRMLALGRRRREAAGELLCGCIVRHSFYAAASGQTVARLEDPDNVPFFMPGNLLAPDRLTAARKLQEAFRRGAGGPVTLAYHGASVPLPTSRAAEAFLDHVDDRATIGEILGRVRGELGSGATDEALLAEVRPTWDALGLFDALLLRHKSVPWSPASS